MARRFTDAIGLLNDLLNRFEAGAASPIAHPDYPAFPSVVAADAFLKQIREAESAGAVSLGWGGAPCATKWHMCGWPRRRSYTDISAVPPRRASRRMPLCGLSPGRRCTTL